MKIRIELREYTNQNSLEKIFDKRYKYFDKHKISKTIKKHCKRYFRAYKKYLLKQQKRIKVGMG